jgi:hypothetical protein
LVFKTSTAGLILAAVVSLPDFWPCFKMNPLQFQPHDPTLLAEKPPGHDAVPEAKSSAPTAGNTTPKANSKRKTSDPKRK